jgi:AraC family transcriptional regulator
MTVRCLTLIWTEIQTRFESEEAIMNMQQEATLVRLQAPAAGLPEWASSLASLLHKAKCELDVDKAAARAAITTASSLLQVEIDRLSSNPEQSASGLAGWQIQRVRSYIENNLDQPIQVKDLSEIARRSPAHFSRAFKRAFGESPHCYIVSRRLARAVDLMLTTELGLAEIAVAAGFTDQAHLSNMFRRKIGVSPASWRRERCATTDDRELPQADINSITMNLAA